MEHSKYILLIICLLSAVVLSKCPSECAGDCRYGGSNQTFQCVQCLQKFLRTYNTTTFKCDCLPDFRQVNFEKCCPKNCSRCSQLGCAACWQNWVMGNHSLGVEICICAPDYYYDFDLDDCFCKSIKIPTEYYYVKISNLCKKCPEGCTCNSSGCVSCSNSTNRTIAFDKANEVHTCFCKQPYIDFMGVCSCTKGCKCENETIFCDSNATYRFTYPHEQNYICKEHYIEVNGVCVCPTEKYYQTESLLNPFTNMCLCKQAPVFYRYLGECRICPTGCVCDLIGCVKCNRSTHRITDRGECPCQQPYIEDSNGLFCLCLEPYYLDEDGNCSCLNRLLPEKVVYNILQNKCYSCPDGCSCDQSGCHTCKTTTNRKVIQLEDDFWDCAICQEGTWEQKGQCVCLWSDQGKCICKTPYSYPDESGNCIECPSGCNCSEFGCISCESYTNRQIHTNQANRSTCTCKIGTHLRNGFCVCYTYDAFTTDCPCSGSYQLKDGFCTCRSQEDPEQFYLDTVKRSCYPCPVGCTCNETGCYSCEFDSLRWNYVDNKTNMSQCPCVQNSVEYQGQCIRCRLHQYSNHRRCHVCTNCKTCNKRGCKTCAQGMHLQNYQCFCDQPAFVNIQGSCKCPFGSYDILVDGIPTCQPCPANCLECKYDNNTRQVVCTICPPTETRDTDPFQDCPCNQNYTDAVPIKWYCCHYSCKTCNQIGCTSCQDSSFRELTQDGQCVCKNNLIELDSKCQCPLLQYMFVDICLPCPRYCIGCLYHRPTRSVVCWAGLNGVHRNGDDMYFPCQKGYKEKFPLAFYCVPIYCTNWTENFPNFPVITCTECLENMVVDEDGQNCHCKFGSFMNDLGDCKECVMEGCIDCFSIDICKQCISSDVYYLTGSTCKKDLLEGNYIYTQSQKGIIIQFKRQVLTTLQNVEGRLEIIKSKVDLNDTVDKPIVLKTLNFSYQKESVICVLFENPNLTVRNYTLSITYYFQLKRLLQEVNQNNTKEYGHQTVHLRRPIFYSKHDTDMSNRGQYEVELAMTIVIMVICCLFYFKGYKHNQIPFFLQTLGFIGFAVKDEKFHMAAFLYNLRWSYYDLGNAISGIVPDYYLEYSKGNFPFLTIDSNIFRVAGTTLLFATINCGLIIIFRAFYLIYKNTTLSSNQQLSLIVRSNKRPLYRILQFFYKTTMYPLLFFSFVTYHDWNALVLIQKHGFHHFSHILAIGLLLAYSGVTIYQFFLEDTSKVNKIENANEFLSAVFGAMIVAVSMHSKAYTALVVIFIFRGAVYIISRRRLLRDFFNIEYLKVVTVCLEVTTILVLISDSAAAAVVLSILTVVFQLMHESSIVFLTEKDARISKLKEPESVHESQARTMTQTSMV